MTLAKKVLIGNIKGPEGPEGKPGPPGDLSSIGGLEEIAEILEDRMNDIPDLSLIFENQLI